MILQKTGLQAKPRRDRPRRTAKDGPDRRRFVDTGNPFFDEVWNSVLSKEEELNSYNCSVLKKKTGFSAQEQLQAIAELEAEGIDGLVISPFNDTAVANKIDQLQSRQIPVITTNTDIRNSSRLAFVGSDFYRCGQTAAGLMNLMTSGEVRAGIVTGSSQVLCHTDRIAGFCDRISACYPRIRIIAEIENSDDDFESYDKTRALLSAHPDINALYFTAAGVYGGCRAVLSLNRTDIHILAYDKIPATKELMGTAHYFCCDLPAACHSGLKTHPAAVRLSDCR